MTIRTGRCRPLVILFLCLITTVTQAEEPDDLSSLPCQELVDGLRADSFFRRQACHRELFRRGFENFEELHLATQGQCAEQRLRARQILSKLSDELFVQLKDEISFEAKVSNPRFWKGNNQYLGGIEDHSLDSSIALSVDGNADKVFSPLRVHSAVCDSGEEVGIQVWQAGWGSSKRASLYLNRPWSDFKEVRVKLKIYYQTHRDNSYRIPLEPGRYELEKNVTWVEVSGMSDAQSKEEALRICVSDYLGRLNAEDSRLRQLPEQDRAGLAYWHSTAYPATAFRKTWVISFSELGSREYLELHLKSGPKVFSASCEVKIPHPENDD